jgi:PleD family two-component response regulator
MMKIKIIIIAVVLSTACNQAEPEISKRQIRQMDKLVEYKLDSFAKARQAICYEQVLEIAKIKADSVISIFETAATIDTLNRPDKPLKPEKPEVTIPAFED